MLGNIQVKYYFDLSCEFDNRANFYGKAKVLEDYEGVLYLKSYDTIVATCENGTVEILGQYSQTTSRHQKEFFLQFDQTNRTWEQARR